MFTFHTVSFH